MVQLFLLRHGQSCWNLENRFTGWVDIPLTEVGKKEATFAGETLQNIKIDHIFTSKLIRAQETALLVANQLHPFRVAQRINPQNDKLFNGLLPIWVDERLNERHYGDLQGKNKSEMIQEFGEAQVHKWRRSYDTRPPGGESLKDTSVRTIEAFNECILPKLNAGQNVLVCAHGNSLRSLMMLLENIQPNDISNVECSTGEVIGYEYFDHQFERK